MRAQIPQHWISLRVLLLTVLLFAQSILLCRRPSIWSDAALSLLAIWWAFSYMNLVRRTAILLVAAVVVAIVPSLEYLSSSDKHSTDTMADTLGREMIFILYFAQPEGMLLVSAPFRIALIVVAVKIVHLIEHRYQKLTKSQHHFPCKQRTTFRFTVFDVFCLMTSIAAAFGIVLLVEPYSGWLREAFFPGLGAMLQDPTFWLLTIIEAISQAGIALIVVLAADRVHGISSSILVTLVGALLMRFTLEAVSISLVEGFFGGPRFMRSWASLLHSETALSAIVIFAVVRWGIKGGVPRC